MRSATVPLRMVVAVVANDNWKKNDVKICPISSLLTLGSGMKSPNAMKGVVYSLRPYESPYPKSQYVKPPSTTSTIFFIIMLTSFFRETIPDSNRPKPVCMLRGGEIAQ